MAGPVSPARSPQSAQVGGASLTQVLPYIAATPLVHLQYLKERKEAGYKQLDARFRKGSSKYRGVSWDKHNVTWQTRARMPQPGGQSKQVKLGAFVDEGEAARAYDRAVIPIYGR